MTRKRLQPKFALLVILLSSGVSGLLMTSSQNAWSGPKRAAASAPPAAAPVDAIAAILIRVRELVKKGESEAALKKLQGDWGQQLIQAGAEPIARFARARILEDLKRDSDAAGEYAKALEKRSPLDSQIRYAAGRLYARTGQFDLARTAFAGVLAGDKNDVPVAIRSRAVFELAKLMANTAEKAAADKATERNASKSWKDVVKTLRPAMKAAKGQEIISSYMYLLLRAKRHLGQSDCKLARDLYAKYPAAAEISAWGPLLPNNMIDGKKLSCSATAKDIQTRLRRLQLQGMVDRSIQEIQDLKSVGVFDAWTLDSFEIGAMLSNGQNQDAMKMLLKHTEEQKGRPQFWNLFGRVTSRLGDFAASSGAYKKAYQLAPKGRAASDALFNSAFASYQMQDYDGAEESFGRLSARYGKAKIARDARWHLAWMSYLRGDFETALERWQSLLREKLGRRQARTDSTSRDRIEYWSGMALLRLGNRDKEAVEIFRKLLRDPSIDYYAILAWYRLKAIPGVQLTEAENRLGSVRSVPEEELKETIADETLDAKTEVAKEKAATAPPAVSDIPVSDVATESEDQAAAEAEPPEGDVEVDEAESAVATEGGFVDVRDPALRPRLDRVRQLYAVGFNEETRWELQKLDSRVRNPQDRRMMMAELHRMGRFDRSSTLAELAFSGPRLRGGLDGARDLWEYAYPRAWPEAVGPAAKSSRVDEELVWSIMRAESHYRADARSPVAASGLMQIMPFTGERVASQLLGQSGFKPSDLLDPETNVRYGARYLQRLSEKFGGSLPLVAASYNAGPHRVQAWLRGFGALRMDEFIEHIPFVETRNYVKKVTRNFQIYRLLYRDDRGSLGWLVRPVGVSPDSGPNALEVW
jgi:soluble lytic murein transglycosylase